MGISDRLVLNRQRHLKWRALDRLEMILMIICGLTLFGCSVSVSLDILTRTLGYPWLWLQEVTSTLFIYGIFVGAAVATRRNDHLYLTAFSDALHGTPRLVVEIIIRGTILTVAACLVYFGYLNYLRGFGSFRLRQRGARIARNPKRSGVKVMVPPKRVPYFKPGKKLKELINQAAPAAAAGEPDKT